LRVAKEVKNISSGWRQHCTQVQERCVQFIFLRSRYFLELFRWKIKLKQLFNVLGILFFEDPAQATRRRLAGKRCMPLIWIISLVSFKLQTLGIQLMKLARKSINWHVDVNVRESLDRGNLELEIKPTFR